MPLALHDATQGGPGLTVGFGDHALLFVGGTALRILDVGGIVIDVGNAADDPGSGNDRQIARGADPLVGHLLEEDHAEEEPHAHQHAGGNDHLRNRERELPGREGEVGQSDAAGIGTHLHEHDAVEQLEVLVALGFQVRALRDQ